MEGFAPRRGCVVALAQFRHDIVKDGVVMRLREGELVYTRRGERPFGVALDPQFTAEGEHRWQTTNVVVMSMS